MDNEEMTEEQEKKINLDETYRCICGYICTGHEILAHYKEKHPRIHKEVCEKIGIED